MKNLGNKVNYPSDEVSDTGEGNEKTNYEGNNVLGFEVSNDSLDTANDCAKEKLDKDLSDLGELFVSLGERCRCHWFVLLYYVFFVKIIISR